jgi:hypothetical protein
MCWFAKNEGKKSAVLEARAIQVLETHANGLPRLMHSYLRGMEFEALVRHWVEIEPKKRENDEACLCIR